MLTTGHLSALQDGSTDNKGRSREEALVDYDRRIEETLAQLEEDPDHPSAWAQLVQLRMFRRAVSGEAKQETREENIRYVRNAHREWIAAQPWNGHAYVGYGATLALEERAEFLAASMALAPNSIDLLKMAMWILNSAGMSDRTLEIAERFLVDNPEIPQGYELVYNEMLRAKNGDMANQVLDAWLGFLPGDGVGLEHWYREEKLRASDSTSRRSLAEELARRIEPGERALTACRQLRSDSFDDLALACYALSLESDLSEAQQEQAQTQMLEMALEAGEASPADIIAQLPPASRSKVLAAAAEKLAEQGDCDPAVELLDNPSFDGRLAHHSYREVYVMCGQIGPHRDRLRALIGRFSDEALSNLVRIWRERQPAEFVEDEALRRLESGADDKRLWTSLDGFYRNRSLTDKRVELFKLWSRVEAEPRSLDVKHWADFLTSIGDYDEVENLLLRVTNRGTEWNHLDKLADFYLRQSRFDEAGVMIERLRQFEDSADSTSRAGELRLARLAWAQGDVGEAEAAYRRVLDNTFNFSSDAFREYCTLLVYNDRQNDLFRALEELYSEASEVEAEMRVAGSLETWVATQLEEIQLLEPAIEYLEHAVIREPRNGSLHERIYGLASKVGRNERAAQALRVLISLDPSSDANRSRLALHEMTAEGPEAALEVLDDLPAGMEESSLKLRASRATALIETGELVEGIRIFRQLEREGHFQDSMADSLHEAYVSLAEREEQDAGERQ
jgi:tetratricopeptide (TPR) repeat protein